MFSKAYAPISIISLLRLLASWPLFYTRSSSGKPLRTPSLFYATHYMKVARIDIKTQIDCCPACRLAVGRV